MQPTIKDIAMIAAQIYSEPFALIGVRSAVRIAIKLWAETAKQLETKNRPQ